MVSRLLGGIVSGLLGGMLGVSGLSPNFASLKFALLKLKFV